MILQAMISQITAISHDQSEQIRNPKAQRSANKAQLAAKNPAQTAGLKQQGSAPQQQRLINGNKAVSGFNQRLGG